MPAGSIVAVELGSAEFWEQLGRSPEYLAAQVCSIDAVNLDDQLHKHAALRAWVNAAHESAKIHEERMRWELTKVRARVLLAASATPVAEVDDKGKKKGKTVGVLEAEVENDRDVQAATQNLLESQEKRVALRAMADALEDRLQMLIQISANRRKEWYDANR